VPASLTLKSNGPAAPFQDATAASSPAATRQPSPAQGARRAAPGGPQQQQQGQGPTAGAKDAAAGNIMKLGLKPVGPGVYPARLVLTSAYDVRHIELAVTAQAKGQACALELDCPARQKVRRLGMPQLGVHGAVLGVVLLCSLAHACYCTHMQPKVVTPSAQLTVEQMPASHFQKSASHRQDFCPWCVFSLSQVVQDLPLLNAGSDAPLSATATLTGKGFSGPMEVSVQAKADGRWALVVHDHQPG
jgi:hypothetical protein